MRVAAISTALRLATYWMTTSAKIALTSLPTYKTTEYFIVKTIETEIKHTFHIWAIPGTEYEFERTGERFYYDVISYEGDHWKEGAVKVSSQELTLVVPEGIDLVAAAVSTYEEALAAEDERHRGVVTDLNLRIKGLLLLEVQA
jgi:hypothetical protein